VLAFRYSPLRPRTVGAMDEEMKDENPHSTFTCSRCGGAFPNAWSEADAEAELARDYPGFDKSECGVLCDECYDRFNAWRANQVERPPYTPPPIPEWARAVHEEYMRRVTHRLLYGDGGEEPTGLLRFDRKRREI
jgi:hypothetical protein